MIGVVDTLTGEPCEACGEPLDGWALHEISEGRWIIVCVNCDLDLTEGK